MRDRVNSIGWLQAGFVVSNTVFEVNLCIFQFVSCDDLVQGSDETHFTAWPDLL